VASLDPPWIAKENLDYALVMIKTALIFFDSIVVDDSQIIDSNQMRFAASREEVLDGLFERRRIVLALRKNMEELLEEVVNRERPMLFSSLDFTSNDRLLSMRREGRISLDALYAEFDDSDLRRGLGNVLIPYREYIRKLSGIAESSARIPVRANEEIFREKFDAFKGKAGIPADLEFRYRTDVYGYIETMNMDNPYRRMKAKSGVKALADLIYILNKSYNVEDDEVFVAFDGRHYEEIERGLGYIGLSVDAVRGAYADKDIRIVKIRLFPVQIDNDVSFFVSNVVPPEMVLERRENFVDELVGYLEEKGDEEKLSFMKFTKKRAKYSRFIERRFPRFRSSIEVLVLAMTAFDLGTKVLTMRRLDALDAALLVISAAASVDGVLGFIEYRSSRRLSTNFYEKISRWYREHLMRITRRGDRHDLSCAGGS